MTGLFVRKEILVDEGSVCIDFVELSVGRSTPIQG